MRLPLPGAWRGEGEGAGELRYLPKPTFLRVWYQMPATAYAHNCTRTQLYCTAHAHNCPALHTHTTVLHCEIKQKKPHCWYKVY